MLKKIMKGLGYLALALVGLSILGAFIGGKKDGTATVSTTADGSVTSAPAVPKKPLLSVSVSQLFKDYHDNEVAADQKYKGKQLAVTGTVQSIDKDAFNNIVVRLRTSNEFMSTMASLEDRHETLAASLRKGDKVVWNCVGGGLVVGSPVLRECAPA